MEPVPSTSRPFKAFVSPRKKRKMSHLSESEKLMIINVFKYVKESWHADKYSSKQEMKDKTADILGISKSTVYRILTEYHKTDTVKPAASPKQRLSLIDKIDDFDKSCIRRIVHSFYLKGELPTVKKVLHVINEDESLPNMGLTSLKKLLKHLQFKYVKRRRNNALIDRDDIALWRIKYLKKIKAYREQERPIYYLDETWVNAEPLWRTLLLSSLCGLVFSGVQQRRRNESESSRPCTLMEFVHTARCWQTQYHLHCRRGIEAEWIKGYQEHVTHLTVWDWPGVCFNVARLQEHFPELRQLEFRNCTLLTGFKGHFTNTSKIEKLVLSGLSSLWELPGEVIAQMPQLREMDLRWNVLRHMKAKLLRVPPRLERVHLSGNKWDCSDGGLDWLAMERDNGTVKRRIVDYLALVCHQQLYRGKPLHKVMDIIRMVQQTCPSPCDCAMTHVVSDSAGAVIPLITVDCAGLGLEAPPATLPPGSTTLRLEGNRINSIHGIIQNPQYTKLADLYLDNNSLPTVRELEGAEWFSTFRVLSLRGNSLKQIPVFAFDKAFQANNDIMHVFLGHNPWRCDCHFTPRFQALLLKYRRVIRDLTDIRCSRSDDKETSLVQISTMQLSLVCSNSTVKMPISAINIVNLILASLIVLIIGRFLYDWHSFKTTGQLPWLSSILP